MRQHRVPTPRVATRTMLKPAAVPTGQPINIKTRLLRSLRAPPLRHTAQHHLTPACHNVPLQPTPQPLPHRIPHNHPNKGARPRPAPRRRVHSQPLIPHHRPGRESRAPAPRPPREKLGGVAGCQAVVRRPMVVVVPVRLGCEVRGWPLGLLNSDANKGGALVAALPGKATGVSGYQVKDLLKLCHHSFQQGSEQIKLEKCMPSPLPDPRQVAH
mmetsp:Transcript_40723/g.106987  ORF Transcript_40723/g.106987 Transcript_40723/m.106987 type:complete len:214 (+) Transcript_40723:149-790(+)